MITEVDLNIDNADAFFPAFDESDWTEIARTPLRDAGPACYVRELIRK